MPSFFIYENQINMKNQSHLSKPIKISAYGILKQHYKRWEYAWVCFATCCGIPLLIIERKKNNSWGYYTWAIAIAPFSVKVLSLRLRMRRPVLCCKAVASAVTPGWLMPFWGMWTSSKLPINWKKRVIYTFVDPAFHAERFTRLW